MQTEIEYLDNIIEYQRYFLAKHETLKSWRKVGEPYGLFPDTVRMIASGYDPGNTVRERLRLPPKSSVVSVNGKVPGGSITLGAHQCECGQYFISNHPRRQKCFICSPYRGKPK